MVDQQFISPVVPPYLITQTYQEHLDYAAAHPGMVYNGGIDLYSDDKTIRAAFSGKIEKVSFQANGYGNYIKIRHDWGFSLYAHLARIYVNVGTEVSEGQSIGLMGTTGFSTGIHLHFELRDLRDLVTNPTKYFEDQPADLNACSPLIVLAAECGGNLRVTPMGMYICTIPHGTVGRKLDGPVYKNGLPCWQVEFPVQGWIAERDNFGNTILEDYGN